MKRLMAIAVAAFALLGADGRDTAIYNGKLTSAMNANGMAITNAPTPVRDGDLANKAYVDGISGVTPGTVTNIANARIDAKVAPWAMSGQPKPEGMTTNAVIDIASSASVTNAGAVASAKTYTDTSTLAATNFVKATVTNYLPLAAGPDYPLLHQLFFSDYGAAGLEFPGGEWFAFYPGDNTFYFRGSDCKISKLKTDDSYVVTSNMLNGVLTPALAQKADRAVPETANNFAALTSSGNLADSGCSTNSFAPAVDGGYLPLAGGTMTGIVFMNENPIYFDGTYSISAYEGRVSFADDETGKNTFLTIDNTDIMTEGQADFHIVSNATVKSGQIANLNLAGLSCKTVTVDFASAATKAGDALLWTDGNAADCDMVFITSNIPYQHGDDDFRKASANKKCLFLFSKISPNDIIITKKEFAE